MLTLWTWLEEARFRWRLYALVAVTFAVLAVGCAAVKDYCKHIPFNLVVSDGRGYYVYLPALAVDGNLDFSRQIRDHWDVDFQPGLLEDRTELGYVRNKYPIGLALTLAPFFLAAHFIALLLFALTGSAWFQPDGYSPLYQLTTLTGVLALGWLTFVMIDRLLVRSFRVSGAAAGAGVVVYWLGTHCAYYWFREPFMVHVVSLFWITACMTLVAAMRDDAAASCVSTWRFVGLAFAFAMALVCRPTNVVLLPFLVYLAIKMIRAGLVLPLLRRLPLAVVGLLPLLAQLTVWKIMTGHWLSYSYGDEGFSWAEPKLWQTLFSSRHGLFFWSPLLALSVAGLGQRLLQRGGGRGPLLVCLLVAFGLLWYCNSAWHCWWFGDSFGGRAFLELSCVFVLGLAFAFERVRRLRQRWQLAVAGFVLVAIVYNYVLMFLYISHRITHADYLL
jgi:hypothetical protein